MPNNYIESVLYLPIRNKQCSTCQLRQTQSDVSVDVNFAYQPNSQNVDVL